MAIYKRGRFWWVSYNTGGKRVEFSTKSENREDAERMQASTRGKKAARRLKKDADPGVYFLKSPALGLVKIGCSGNSRQRISDLRNMNADDLVLAAHIKTERYRAAESIIHCFFKEKHSHREWFRITDEDIDFAVKYWERIQASNKIVDDYSTPLESDRLYDLKEIAEMLAMSAGFVRKLIRDGQLRMIKVGRLVRVSGADLQEYIDNCRYVVEPKIVGNTQDLPASGNMDAENATT